MTRTRPAPSPRAPLRRVLAGLAWLLLAAQAQAGGGPFGIDHILPKDESGIFKRQTQLNVLYAVGVANIGTALWQGTDSRFGKTAWQATDALVASAVSTSVVKRVFSRTRPRDGNDPNLFFQGRGNESFVSGEVSAMTALVTPWMLEYGHDQPAVYLLAALPVYDGVARLKSQAHWQSDVLGAALLGGALGYYAHGRKSPLVLSASPNGVFVGWKTKF